jgi:chemotaxis protein MotB
MITMDDRSNYSAAPTIILVKRKSHGEHEPHGGVWKIAYADFMTAMMAFFLVMWLVNSADEKTIVQVASYFNPMKLSEKSQSQKGLHDGTSPSRDGMSTDRSDPKSKAKDAPTVISSGIPVMDRRAQIREARMFLQPIAAIDALDTHPTRSGAVEHAIFLMRPADSAISATDQVKEVPAPDKPERRVLKSQNGTPIVAPSIDEPRGSARKTNEEELADISRSIARAIVLVADPKPSVDVTSVGGDILITVTDDEAHDMFARGSAEPRPALIALMSRIGGVLSRRAEAIVVRGHTDTTPFRSPVYDNWRLSTARAHMAHYMLLRVGIAADRIERIEGYGDRQLRNRSVPNSSENRRIELLLRALASRP